MKSMDSEHGQSQNLGFGYFFAATVRCVVPEPQADLVLLQAIVARRAARVRYRWPEALLTTKNDT